MKKIGIIGCGWLGIRIAKHLSGEYTFFVTTTRAEKAAGLEGSGLHPSVIQFPDDHDSKNLEQWQEIANMEAVIITVPFSKKTSPPHLEKRFGNLIRFLGPFQGKIILMSSIGIYPQESMEITEDNLPESTLHPGLLFVENFMRIRYPHISILRLGGLMGDDRYLSKYKIEDTSQPVNHIHYEDVSRVVEMILQQNLSGKIFNVVAPLHPSKDAVIRHQLQLPDMDLKTAFGRIISSNKLVNDAGFTFKHPDPILFK